MPVIFVLGILAIALEDKIKINKAAIALFMAISMWMILMFDAYNIFVERSSTIFQEFLTQNPEMASLRNTAMITIAAAKLSNKAEKKKVAKLIYHNSLRLFGVRIYPVTALKPPCLSTISTINMEHITKKSVSETFPK